VPQKLKAKMMIESKRKKQKKERENFSIAAGTRKQKHEGKNEKRSRTIRTEGKKVNRMVKEKIQ
jgi:hypothetical protein